MNEATLADRGQAAGGSSRRTCSDRVGRTHRANDDETKRNEEREASAVVASLAIRSTTESVGPTRLPRSARIKRRSARTVNDRITNLLAVVHDTSRDTHVACDGVASFFNTATARLHSSRDV